MRIFTAINRFLLRRVGYVGPLINWGESSIDGGPDVYEWLEVALAIAAENAGEPAISTVRSLQGGSCGER